MTERILSRQKFQKWLLIVQVSLILISLTGLIPFIEKPVEVEKNIVKIPPQMEDDVPNGILLDHPLPPHPEDLDEQTTFDENEDILLNRNLLIEAGGNLERYKRQNNSLFQESLSTQLSNKRKIDDLAESRVSTPSPTMVTHEPIMIDGNNDFSSNATIEEWLGAGTPSDPYIIDGLNISGAIDDLIAIKNVDLYFRIVNCLLTGGGGYGVSFKNVTNGQIINNTISNNGNGIYLENSSNNSSSNNTISNNGYYGICLEDSSNNNSISNNTISSNYWDGIYLRDSSNTTISNNTISDNSNYGIRLYSSSNNNINSNNLIANGLFVGGHVVEHCLQSAVVDNMVNGRPLIFWQNTVGGTIPSGAGQVVLVNVSAVTVRGQNLSNASVGLVAVFSQSLYILDNTISNNDDDGIWLDSSSNNTISNNTISNNDDGIDLWFSSNNSINNNTISSNYWDGIDLWFSSNNTINNNTLIANGLLVAGNVVEDCLQSAVVDNMVNGRPLIFWQNTVGGTIPSGAGQVVLVNVSAVTVRGQNLSNASVGLVAVFSQSLYILDNTISNNWNGIYLYSSSNNNTISNNTISNTYDGIRLYRSSDNTISNNTISSNNDDGIWLDYSSNNTISNNTISSNNDDGISLWSSSNNTISNNTINSNTCQGIELGYSSNNTISSNTISNNDYGIWLWSSSNNTISNNTISNNVVGIDLDSSSNTTISNNNIGNNWNGILLDSSSNTISNNNISNNNFGIYLRDSSNNNTISSNTISSNNWNGIQLYSSSSNTISYNTISNNSNSGIYLWDSSNTIISYNDFIGNNLGGSQAFDGDNSGIDNTFRYNYWDDWTSPDSNDDGIVDDPYAIAGNENNEDPYPMTTPFHLLSAPTVTYPTGGETFNGTVTIQWSGASDSLGHAVTYDVYYSADSGTSWTLLATSLTTTSYDWDTTTVADGTNYLVLVNATCSEGLSAIATCSSTFTIANVEPSSSSSSATTATTTTSEGQQPVSFAGLSIILLSIAALAMIRQRSESG